MPQSWASCPRCAHAVNPATPHACPCDSAWNAPVCTTSTGKVVDVDQVSLDLLSKDPSKGAYYTTFADGSELYTTAAEYREVRAAHEAWRKAGGYNRKRGSDGPQETAAG